MPTHDFCLGLLLGVGLLSTGLGQVRPPLSEPPLQTFAVETRAISPMPARTWW